jgi:hypothetical protein
MRRAVVIASSMHGLFASLKRMMLTPSFDDKSYQAG